MKYKIHPDRISPLYVIIVVLFVCILMIANISVNRLISVGGIILGGDFLLFPVTYIFDDILTEVYGFERSRLVIWVGFLANIIMAIYFSVILNLPYPKEFTANGSFKIVLGTTPLVVIASISAYLCGEFSNSVILSVMKKITKGKLLWLRTIGSTLIGEAADTIIFCVIVFYNMPFPVIGQIVFFGYVFKVAYEVLATPITYFVIRKIKDYEKLDTYDYGVKYNPFSLDLSRDNKHITRMD